MFFVDMYRSVRDGDTCQRVGFLPYMLLCMLPCFHTLIALFIHVISILCSLSGIRYLIPCRLDLHTFFITTAVPSTRGYELPVDAGDTLINSLLRVLQLTASNIFQKTLI